MTQVTVGENEGIESALRRFKRQVSKAGIFADLKRLRHHETPVEKYKRKAQQRRRRRGSPDPERSSGLRTLQSGTGVSTGSRFLLACQ